MDSHTFWLALDADLAEVARTLRPVRVTIGAISNGLATVQTGEMTTPTDEGYARIEGFDLSPGQEAWALYLDPGWLILGPAQRSNPSGHTLAAPLTAAIPNSVYCDAYSSTSVTNSTNASTGTPIEAAHYAFTLPSGTWSVRLVVSVLATHSANGQAYCQPSLDGSAISSDGAAVNSSVPSRVVNSGLYTGIASGAHTAYVNFRPNQAGTMTVSNPQILINAWRTA